MAITPRPPQLDSVKTAHGTASYFNASSLAARALASAYLPTGKKEAAAVHPVAVLEAVSTAADFAGAAAASASTGVSLTEYLSSYYSSGGAADVPPALEIEVENNSSQPLVLFNYTAYQAEVSKASQSLFPGETDIVLVTRNKAFSDQDSFVALFFLISGVYVAVIYGWSNSSGLWLVDACIDPIFASKHKLDPGQVNGFPANQQLFGAGFAGNAGYPNFSFFTSNVNTPSGQIDLDFYDYAQPKETAPTAGPEETQ